MKKKEGASDFLLEKNLRGGEGRQQVIAFKNNRLLFLLFFLLFFNFRGAKVVLGGRPLPPVAESRHLVFTFSQISTSNSYNFSNLQPILNCNIPKFKLKHQHFKKDKMNLSSELVFLLFSNKRVEVFGTTGS